MGLELDTAFYDSVPRLSPSATLHLSNAAQLG